jgi:hypothetical protein
MPSIHARRVLPLLAVALSIAGCASRESREAGYDRWLSPWQGASEESLRVRWGRPVSEEAEGSGKRLVYVYSQPPGSGSTLGISIGGFGIGGGGHTAVGVGVGGTVPLSPGDPQTCTTYFHVEQGKVVSWSFEGAGCAAP